MNQRIVSVANIFTSPVNTILRNPLRVLNHMGLINEKIQYSGNYNLIYSQNSAFVGNMRILDALQKNEISVEQALHELAASSSRGSVADLQQKLSRVYSTGLLEFHITDVCDLDCIECHYRHKGNETIPYSAIASLLSKLQPKAIIITGGGEPNVYRSEGKNMNDVVLEIKRALPDVSLGLINNNTKLVSGSWMNHIQWQRTSVDAANAATYNYLKRRNKFDVAVLNVKRLLLETKIPHVGVGFLYRAENISELSDFTRNWFKWVSTQPESIRLRFNLQFRPIAPGIDNVEAIRSGKSLLVPHEIQHQLANQVELVRQESLLDSCYATFLGYNTNFQSLIGRDLNQLHDICSFNNCFNAITHRVLRSTGEEYPDFLLCNDPQLSLGNPLINGEMDFYRVALLQLWYFNKRGPFCTEQDCRQGWVNQTVEKHINGQLPKEVGLHDYFF